MENSFKKYSKKIHGTERPGSPLKNIYKKIEALKVLQKKKIKITKNSKYPLNNTIKKS